LLVTRVQSGSFTSATSSAVENEFTSASFSLETLDEGEIANSTTGTKDNVKWEIQSVNTESGVFSLLIRRGDDTHSQKKVLETFSNLSLDPKAPNYITKVIGDTSYSVEQDGTDYYVKSDGTYTNKSKYVRVGTVNYPTVDYFDNDGNAKDAFTGSLPVEGSGSFGGAAGTLFEGQEAKWNDKITSANIQGLGQLDYTQSLDLLTNKDDYRFNLITVPGLNHSDHATAVNKAVTLAEDRQDCLAVIDLDGYNTNVGTIVSNASALDSSYAAAYWPWLQTIEPSTAQTVWVPASTMIPGVYAFTDRSSEAWFAPAGLTRGALGNVTKVEL